jgi:hypothetical protein
VHDEDPAAEYVIAAQLLQDDEAKEPVAAVYFPAAQLVQAVCAVPSW